MSVVVSCPNPACAARCSVAEVVPGQALRCPRCGQTFALNPANAAPPPAMPAPPPAPAPVPAPAAAKPTRTIGRYRLRSKLGGGAFGTVYRAHDPQLDREIALKVLRSDALASPRAVERFHREARAAARMLHPNIVPVYDAGSHGRTFYIASAFISGRTLSALIPKEGLDPRRAVALAVQLVDALAYAHGQGVLHRDIKSDNCLVDDQCRLYLTDFGLAASLQETGPRLTRDGAVMGTPAYMAPEQAAGEVSQVDAAADQYGAGVVLYELLTGRTPFVGPPAAMLFNILQAPVPPPGQFRAGLDPVLDAICLKALRRRKEERYLGCEPFAAALRSWLAKQPSLPDLVLPPAARPPAAPTEPELEWQETVAPIPLGSPEATSLLQPSVPWGAAGRTGRGTVAGIPLYDTAPPVVPPPPPPPRRQRQRSQADRTELLEEPRGGSGWKVALAAVALLCVAVLVAGGCYFLYKVRADRQAAVADKKEDRPDDKPEPDIKTDIDTVNRLVRSGKGGDGHIREVGTKHLALWRKAADQGKPEGQYLLSRCYALGVGVDKDASEAVRWCRLAAAQEFSLARNDLGTSYEQGQGVGKDTAEAARWYRLAAEQGNPAAMHNLGRCCEKGIGVKIDPIEAFRWYGKSAEQGNVNGQNDLGRCYEHGIGTGIDMGKAVTWYGKASDQGHAEALVGLKRCSAKATEGPRETPKLAADVKDDVDALLRQMLTGKNGVDFVREKVPTRLAAWKKAAADGFPEGQFLMARCSAAGIGVIKSPSEAVRLLRLAAERNYAPAQNALGQAYGSGEGVFKDDVEAVQWYRKAADQGFALGQGNLGVCYRYGRGVARNDNEAVKWLRKAADQEYAVAQDELGLCCYLGYGTFKDQTQAATWFRKAAEQGYPPAEFRIGLCAFNGEGIDKDSNSAFFWFQRAADHGHADGQNSLGVCYMRGVGVTKDPERAVFWYRKSADQDNSVAQANLASCYLFGTGLPKDPEQAVFWYRKSADKGNDIAQANLAFCYWDGNGVGKDRDQAIRLWKQAAAQGNTSAQKALERNDVRVVGTWDMTSTFEKLPKNATIAFEFSASGKAKMIGKVDGTEVLEWEGTYTVDGSTLTLRIGKKDDPDIKPSPLKIKKLTDRDLSLEDEQAVTMDLRRR